MLEIARTVGVVFRLSILINFIALALVVFWVFSLSRMPVPWLRSLFEIRLACVAGGIVGAREIKGGGGGLACRLRRQNFISRALTIAPATQANIRFIDLLVVSKV